MKDPIFDNDDDEATRNEMRSVALTLIAVLSAIIVISLLIVLWIL